MGKESRRVKELRDGLLKALDEMRTWIKEHGESVQTALQEHADTTTVNLQSLCDYVDVVEDKVNGSARAMYAYTELVAQELEDLTDRVNKLEHTAYAKNAEARDEGWAPRLNEEILVGAAQEARERRLEAWAARNPDVPPDGQQDDQGAAEEGDERPLHEMSDQELLAATEAEVENETETQYPPGTQMFGD